MNHIPLPGENGQHYRDGTLTQKKQQQWQKEKEEGTNNWFYPPDRNRTDRRSLRVSNRIIPEENREIGTRMDSLLSLPPPLTNQLQNVPPSFGISVVNGTGGGAPFYGGQCPSVALQQQTFVFHPQQQNQMQPAMFPIINQHPYNPPVATGMLQHPQQPFQQPFQSIPPQQLTSASNFSDNGFSTFPQPYQQQQLQPLNTLNTPTEIGTEDNSPAVLTFEDGDRETERRKRCQESQKNNEAAVQSSLERATQEATYLKKARLFKHTLFDEEGRASPGKFQEVLGLSDQEMIESILKQMRSLDRDDRLRIETTRSSSTSSKGKQQQSSNRGSIVDTPPSSRQRANSVLGGGFNFAPVGGKSNTEQQQMTNIQGAKSSGSLANETTQLTQKQPKALTKVTDEKTNQQKNGGRETKAKSSNFVEQRKAAERMSFRQRRTNVTGGNPQQNQHQPLKPQKSPVGGNKENLLGCQQMPPFEKQPQQIESSSSVVGSVTQGKSTRKGVSPPTVIQQQQRQRSNSCINNSSGKDDKSFGLFEPVPIRRQPSVRQKQVPKDVSIGSVQRENQGETSSNDNKLRQSTLLNTVPQKAETSPLYHHRQSQGELFLFDNSAEDGGQEMAQITLPFGNLSQSMISSFNKTPQKTAPTTIDDQQQVEGISGDIPLVGSGKITKRRTFIVEKPAFTPPHDPFLNSQDRLVQQQNQPLPGNAGRNGVEEVADEEGEDEELVALNSWSTTQIESTTKSAASTALSSPNTLNSPNSGASSSASASRIPVTSRFQQRQQQIDGGMSSPQSTLSATAFTTKSTRFGNGIGSVLGVGPKPRGSPFSGANEQPQRYVLNSNANGSNQKWILNGAANGTGSSRLLQQPTQPQPDRPMSPSIRYLQDALGNTKLNSANNSREQSAETSSSRPVSPATSNASRSSFHFNCRSFAYRSLNLKTDKDGERKRRILDQLTKVRSELKQRQIQLEEEMVQNYGYGVGRFGTTGPGNGGATAQQR